MREFEVVVVGGGIGGLTAAALLAARGLSVCLCERGPRVGGCASSFEEAGFEFEAGGGLYAGWGPGDIHRRVFDELPAPAPEAHLLWPAYVVRLGDGTDVRVGLEAREQQEELRRAFPECADAALRFYLEAARVAAPLRAAAVEEPGLAASTRRRRLGLILRHWRAAPRILSAVGHTAARHLAGTSERFRSFVDAQLRLFASTPAERCAYLYAAVALTEAQRGLYSLRGGGQALADSLADSIRLSGGSVLLNTTALRLVFDSAGRAAGVDLLGGVRLGATRAVVSNLTIRDTYDRLVGRERTPPEVAARLKTLRGDGACLVFVGVEEEAAGRLPSERVIAAAAPSANLGEGGAAAEHEAFAAAPFMFSAPTALDAHAPPGRRAATFSTPAEVGHWFGYDAEGEGEEELDRAALAECWSRLHAALPELGAGAEVYETATPRTFYERTRRRLGSAGGLGQSPELFGPRAPTHRTRVPRLFAVGDTVFPGNGVAAVTLSALAAADEIAPRRP
ncbi:MAG TPA: FAD-dependent oxidoreductase [Pyrinomonadaceae bacterium]|nr:FAD-dependent oxidoreductase [Pyrinomonadaceae bacterium]